MFVLSFPYLCPDMLRRYSSKRACLQLGRPSAEVGVLLPSCTGNPLAHDPPSRPSSRGHQGMSPCCSSRLAIIRSLVSSLPSLDLDLAYELNLTCDLDSDSAND